MVNNHGDGLRPLRIGNLGPLPNGRFMACKWGVIRSPLTSPGMILQAGRRGKHSSEPQPPGNAWKL